MDQENSCSREERLKAILEMDINDIDLSVRAYNVLARQGIKTVGDLAKCSRFEVEHFRNAGRRTIEEIEAKLHAFGVGFASEEELSSPEMIEQRRIASKEWALNREMLVRDVPEQYRPLYIKLKQKVKGRTTGSELKRALQAMLVEDPKTMGKALQDTVVLSAIEDGIAAKERELKEEKHKVKRREDMVTIREGNYENKRAYLEHEQQKADAKKAAADEASEMLRKALEEMETPAARDRLRAYNLYVADMKDKIRTPQNNTLFLAGAASLLAGTPITMKGENE